MLLALALFAAGVAEYILAAYWTHVVVTKKVGRTAATTFLNVMLWGFVVANLKLSDPALLVTHGLGCALGAASMCWVTKATRPARAAAAGRKRSRETRAASPCLAEEIA